MGVQLGVKTHQACSSSSAIKQALPSKVLQEADDYSTAKCFLFRRLAMMQESKESQAGDTGMTDKGSKWDIVRESVTLRNKEFLAALLQTDAPDPDDHGQDVELATQSTLVVVEE